MARALKDSKDLHAHSQERESAVFLREKVAKEAEMANTKERERLADKERAVNDKYETLLRTLNRK
jgi:hypothetical protein